MAGLVNAPNKVPQAQREVQQAYRAHNRIWRIRPGPLSRLYVPYLVLLWGTTGATMYAMGRKVFGYNSFFGEK
ncbi:hypothetical protein DL546_004064 [Coniochaeta pulveracea]|uniref:Uncharacterized protein n=1 Tax=Coniochaeta pulveracea TaxID=177199 RepID=A0A420YDE3_9PEZI|nr:hypothetical protein DL546_004064 [Coniochaeta pulveracea]